MWVNIDDLMAELERLERKTKEEFDGEENSNFKTLLYGMLVGYSEVEMMLCKLASPMNIPETQSRLSTVTTW